MTSTMKKSLRVQFIQKMRYGEIFVVHTFQLTNQTFQFVIPGTHAPRDLSHFSRSVYDIRCWLASSTESTTPLQFLSPQKASGACGDMALDFEVRSSVNLFSLDEYNHV